LIDNTVCSSLHFTGIFGSGMSAIAQYCRWQGLAVSGSDRLGDNAAETADVRGKLEAIGCRLFPQDGSGVVPRTSAVVVSTAIEQSNPDVAAARLRAIPVFHRSDVLAAIVGLKKTIAVAGTSGKSSVAAMIFHILHHAGRRPSLIAGANLHDLVRRGYIGNAFSDASPLLVIEADESDGSLVKYRPSISVFLNISKDHKPVDETMGMFRTLAAQSSVVIANGDEPLFDGLNACERFGCTAVAGFSADMAWDAASATVMRNGRKYRVPFPGKHMADNLCAALCVCAHLGVDEDTMAAAALTYRGLQRRFDRIATKRGVTVIDDYAHNPEKIRAALLAAQSLSARVTALFQPHGFGPLRFMFDELVAAFAATLRASDTLVLLPIYYAGGTVEKDVSSKDIAARLRAGCAATVIAPDSRDEAPVVVARLAHSGDVVILMGARDPSLPLFAGRLAAAIDGL